MRTEKTHSGVIVTREGNKRFKLRETATSWVAGRNETYDKKTGHRIAAPLTKRRLLLETIKPLEPSND